MGEPRYPIRFVALALLLPAMALAAEDSVVPDDTVSLGAKTDPPGFARLRVAATERAASETGALPEADATTSTVSGTVAGSAGSPAPANVATGVQWRLAPIVFGGDLGYELRMTRPENQPGTIQNLFIGNVRGRSYVWQPWFVQVRGGLGFVASRQHLFASEFVGAGPDQKPVTLTGNIGLTVFPVSRFPFDGSYEVSDTRTSGQITSFDYTSARLSLRQSYTTLDGGTFVAGRYERSVLESESFGRDRVDNAEVNITKSAGPHNLQADANHATNEREMTGQSAVIDRVALRDTYRPSALASLDTLAYVTDTQFDAGDSGMLATQTRTAQLTSFGTWRPAEQSPLYVTGNVRALSLENGIGDFTAATQTFNGSLGANYQYSQRLRFLGNLGLTNNRSETASLTSTTQSAGVTYTPPVVPLGKVLASWNASANVANQTVSDVDSRQAVSGGIGYNLTRTFGGAQRAQTAGNFGQNLTTAYDTVTGERRTLTSTVGLTWSDTGESGTADFASLTLSDSRTSGSITNEFQLANLQATRQSILSRLSSWSGNITIQGTRQHTEANFGGLTPTATTTATETRSMSYSINFTYQHQAAFGIRNLRFLALATANSQQLESRVAGDINAPPERIDNSVELRFDYVVGRVVARLSFRTAEIAGTRQEQLLFRVTRYFGTP